MFRQVPKSSAQSLETHVLIRDDLDTDDMSSSFEDLLQYILRDPRVEATNVESPFVWFRGCTTHISASASWGHHIPRHRRGDSGRDRVGVLRDNHGRSGRRWHVGGIGLAISLGCIVLLVRGSSRRLRRRMGRRSRSRHVIRHCCGGNLGCCDVQKLTIVDERNRRARC
jgi:hypothetical protein